MLLNQVSTSSLEKDLSSIALTWLYERVLIGPLSITIVPEQYELIFLLSLTINIFWLIGVFSCKFTIISSTVCMFLFCLSFKAFTSVVLPTPGNPSKKTILLSEAPYSFINKTPF